MEIARDSEKINILYAFQINADIPGTLGIVQILLIFKVKESLKDFPVTSPHF